MVQQWPNHVYDAILFQVCSVLLYIHFFFSTNVLSLGIVLQISKCNSILFINAIAPVAPAIAQGGGSKGRTRAGGSRGGMGRRRGRGCGRVRGQGDAVPEVFQSYDDKDDGNALPAFTPDRPPGVHFDVPLLRSTMVKAVDFFNLYFTVDMIDFIVNHTNSYAWEHITDNSHRSYALPDGSWQETNRDEIRKLIALLIYFGIVKVGSSVDKYWSTKSLYHGLWARSIMSRHRYFALMAMLHVVDPASEDATDKLREVDSFVKYFKTRCLSLYQPRQNVAIDERMVKSRHRSGIRQYIKDKPTKWGIKLWVLADSSNGYTVDFNVYIGKAAGRQVSANGLGYDVVMKLMAPLFNQGYHLYVDNFYTSLTLFKDLFARGVPATGTALETRRDFPVNLKNGKEWAKNKDRGSMRWERDCPCLALQWLDNKVVSVITTIDNANVKTEVNRKIRTDGKWSSKKVPQPGAISNYNKFMNAVDRSDQILGTNSVLRKCMKWWKTLFFHLIDMSVVNSFILFKEHQTKFPDREGLKRPANYNITNFREDIVRQLCDFEEVEQPPAHSTQRPVPPPVRSFVTEHLPRSSLERRNCVVCYKLHKTELRVNTFCSAPQCGCYMHITSGRDCFAIFHSAEYHK